MCPRFDGHELAEDVGTRDFASLSGSPQVSRVFAEPSAPGVLTPCRPSKLKHDKTSADGTPQKYDRYARGAYQGSEPKLTYRSPWPIVLWPSAPWSFSIRCTSSEQPCPVPTYISTWW